MENFITIDMFLSLTACITIVALGTQLLKKYVNYDAKWLALILSAIVTIVRIIVVADYSLLGIVIGIFNILPILLGSIGEYETLVKPIVNKISDTKTETEKE
ncbi:MAG TPA: hypothetical protein IAB40_06320 [Candidatus Onthocola stercoravium]|nr:hypothetical protein [Candidatus Onthocola stercoravium]